MPKPLPLPLVILAIFLVTAISTVLFFKLQKGYKPAIYAEMVEAQKRAQKLWRQAQDNGVDLSNGPCLSNDLLPGWVADVVHNPRQKIDELPQNQCAAFIEGRATHFVEVDLNGKVVKVQ